MNSNTLSSGILFDKEKSMIFSNIRHFRPLRELMHDYACCRLSFDELPLIALQEMTALAMRCVGPDAILCIAESDDLPSLAHLTSKSLKGEADPTEIFVQLRNMAISYFHKDLEEMYENIRTEMEYDMKWDAGLRPHSNPQTGETEWR